MYGQAEPERFRVFAALVNVVLNAAARWIDV
jgi:hypothetical protein